MNAKDFVAQNKLRLLKNDMARHGNADIAELAGQLSAPPEEDESRKKSTPPAWSFGSLNTKNKKIQRAEALKFKGNSMVNLRAPQHQ